MRLRFVLLVGLRYFRAKRENKKIASPILSATGIAVGVMTLVVVLAVMNGFQLSFVEPILEVKSYHVQIRSPDGSAVSEGALERIRATRGVDAVVPFVELQSVAGASRPCIIRGVDARAVEEDEGFIRSFDPAYARPGWDRLRERGTAVLGSELAGQLGVGVGDSVSFFVITGAAFEGLSPRGERLYVSGLFKTGFYEIDLSWAFVSLDTTEALADGAGTVYGIKLKDRFRDAEAADRLKDALSPDAASIESWREYNRVFFRALRTEKTVMMLLIGLIFVVVGFNIFHSLRRSVYERRAEIATLKSLGASNRSIRNVFVSEGILVGALGSLLGLVAGLLLAAHINAFFRLVEAVANEAIIPAVRLVLEPVAGELAIAPVSIFSPSVFYIEQVPVRVMFVEVFIVCLAAVACSSLAAHVASAGIVRFRPAVIIRNE